MANGGVNKQNAAAVAALSELANGDQSIRDRVFDGENVALTRYRMRDGIWVQVTVKDTTLQRSGHGYLLLSQTAAIELVAAILDVSPRLFSVHHTPQELR